MGWNGSQGSEGKAVPKYSSSRFILGLACVSLLFILGIFLGIRSFWSTASVKDNEHIELKQNNSRIIEAKPTLNGSSLTRPTRVAQKPSAKTLKTLPDGTLMLYHADGSQAWSDPRKPPSSRQITNDTTLAHMTVEQKIFKHKTDVYIAWLLNTEPGETLLGDIDYSIFDTDFLETLSDPILNESDDDEFASRLKSAVREVRDELLRRCNTGEKLSDVMTAARKELQELGLYREELKEQITKIVENSESDHFTEKDYNDLLNAANQMLEDRGAKPISMPAIVKYKLDLERNDIDEE